MRIKQLLSDFAVYGLAPIFPKIAAFFVLPIITPYLTSSDFGIFGIIMAYSVLLELFFTLGLHVNLSNSFFKSPKQFKWLWRQIYGFWVHWAILFGLIKSALLWYIIPTEASDNAVLIIILNVVPIVLFGPTSMMASLYYQYKKSHFKLE